MRREIFTACWVACGVLALPQLAAAAILYASALPPQNQSSQAGFYYVDTSKSPVTPTKLSNQPTHDPDSLVFLSGGDMLYTAYYQGALRRFNPNTGADTLVYQIGDVGTQVPLPVDIAVDPTGKKALVTTQGGAGGNKGIDLIDIVNNKLLFHYNVSGYSGSPEGIVWLPNGRIFAVMGTNAVAELSVSANNQINFLKDATGYQGLDGLTYDDTKNFLYVAVHDPGSTAGVVRIDMNSLSSSTELKFSALNNPDGIEFDGNHTLYVASRGDAGSSNGAIYTLNTNAWSNSNLKPVLVADVPWLDDITFGPAMQSAAPEPATLLLAGCGVISLLAYRCRPGQRARVRVRAASRAG